MVTRLTGITVLPWQGHPSNWANLSNNKHFGSPCRVNSVKARIRIKGSGFSSCKRSLDMRVNHFSGTTFLQINGMGHSIFTGCDSRAKEEQTCHCPNIDHIVNCSGKKSSICLQCAGQYKKITLLGNLQDDVILLFSTNRILWSFVVLCKLELLLLQP